MCITYDLSRFKKAQVHNYETALSEICAKKYELLDWDKEFSDHRGQVIEF